MKTEFKRNAKRIIKKAIRSKAYNLDTFFMLIFALGIIYVFPVIVNTVVTLTMLVVITGLGLISFVVVHRTLDYRARPLQQRLIEALPDNAFKYAAMGKFLSGGFERYKVIEPSHQIEDGVTTSDIIDIEPTVIHDYSFDEAYNQSDKFTWNIGQINGTEELATFNFTKQSHVLVCGGTNCGKTSTTGFMLALYALKSKFHVIVFDGAGGSDWNEFKLYTEHYEASPEHLEVIISNIERLYAERQDKLKEYGVADNYSLDKPLQPIEVVIDELGYLLDGLKAEDKNKYKEIVLRFKKMIRVIRKTSIHLVLIDQNANSIPQDILTNIKCIFAYNAEGYIGNAIKRFNLDKLKPQGQFDYGHRVVNGWYTKQFLPHYLPAMPTVKKQLMLTVASEAKQYHTLKDDCIVVSPDVLKETEDTNQSIAAIGGHHSTLQYNPTNNTESSKPVSKAITNRMEFVQSLIEKIKLGQTINDSQLRQFHKDWYQKSIDGNSSKLILEYLSTNT